jgi:hypothetical protein
VSSLPFLVATSLMVRADKDDPAPKHGFWATAALQKQELFETMFTTLKFMTLNCLPL